MSNTILSSKNTFEGGLVMDFSPSNSRSNTLSSALNATFITLNGNELQLLNDMGNGRVETARLPEGYIPVGTCEFGDIIYIVSYNPLTNKSLIGCFPSPERNISSKEISDIEQVLSYTDFQEIDKDGNLTGSLKNTTVKKVLIETKKLNPGDKYIVYTDDPDNIIKNANFLSDWGKGEHGIDPKYLKLHIVSIEDLGKITYLDTTTKWYDIENTIGSFLDYYISAIKNNTSGETEDLDSYRNNIESNWSIFNSKVSGKLAILAELESIDSFSCSYELELSDITASVLDDGHTREYKQYKLYLYPEHTSKHNNIKPSSICASKSSFTTLDPCKVSYTGYKLNNNEIVTEIITENAIFEGDLDNVFTESLDSGWGYSTDCIDTGIIFKIPHKDIINNEEFKISSESFIYNLEIIPCMEYGRLDQFKQTITIDFNKIGSGEVELSTWKYHNTEEQSVLTFGVNYYPQPQHEIKAIIIDFYDNLGICTEYRLLGRKSYNGTFTEYLQLGTLYENVNNSKFYSSKLQNYQTSEKVLSKLEADEITHYTDASFSEGVWSSGKVKDVNVIYPNFLYGVKIRVLTAREGDSEDSKQEHVFYRWYWTTTMYNDYYYQYDDFDILGFNLELTGEILFASKNNFKWEEQTIDNLTYFEDKTKSYSANVYTIGEDDQSNLKMSIYAGLTNNYGCFNLYHKPEITDGVYKALDEHDTVIWLTVKDGKISENNNSYTIEEFKNLHENYIYSFDNPLNGLEVGIYLGGGKIVYSNSDYFWSELEENITLLKFIKKEDIEINAGAEFNNLNDLSVYNIGLSDICNLKFDDSVKYQTSEDYNYYYKLVPLLSCIYPSINDESHINLVFKALLFNKSYVESQIHKTIDVPVYKPIISTPLDLIPLGINYYERGLYTRLYFPECLTMGNEGNTATMAGLRFTPDPAVNYMYTGTIVEDDADYAININSNVGTAHLKSIWDSCTKPSGLFFLTYPAATVTVNNCANPILATVDTTNWRSSYFEITSYISLMDDTAITRNIFDVNANGSFKVYEDSMVPFLSVKVNDSFVLLNSAYVSKYDENYTGRLTQHMTSNRIASNPEHRIIPYEDNFATLLYILLSNTYHNKCVNNEYLQMDSLNIISNLTHKSSITKDIIIKIIPKSEYIHNIVFNNMDFNYYIYMILSQFNHSLNYSNVLLNYNESAIQTNLTIEKDVSSIINNSGILAYYVTLDLKLHPLYNDINPNTFYTLLEGELTVYLDYKVYQFPIESDFFGMKPLYTSPYGRDKISLLQHLNILQEYSHQFPAYVLFFNMPNIPNMDNVSEGYRTAFFETFGMSGDIFDLYRNPPNNILFLHIDPLSTVTITHNEVLDSIYAYYFRTIKSLLYIKNDIEADTPILFSFPLFRKDKQNVVNLGGFDFGGGRLFKILCKDQNGNYIKYYVMDDFSVFDLFDFYHSNIVHPIYITFDNVSGNNDFYIAKNTNGKYSLSDTIIMSVYAIGKIYTQNLTYENYPLLYSAKITPHDMIDETAINRGYTTPLANYEIIELKYDGNVIGIAIPYDPAEEYNHIINFEINIPNQTTILRTTPHLNTTIPYNRHLFNCALGLNTWFDYDGNTLIATNIPPSEQFGYGTKGTDKYINAGILDYYIDYDFKINEYVPIGGWDTRYPNIKIITT